MLSTKNLLTCYFYDLLPIFIFLFLEGFEKRLPRTSGDVMAIVKLKGWIFLCPYFYTIQKKS